MRFFRAGLTAVLAAAAIASAQPSPDVTYFDYVLDEPGVTSLSTDFVDALIGRPAAFAGNPAALGLPGRGDGGALTTDYESVYPQLNLPDFNAFSHAFLWKGPERPWGAALSLRTHALIYPDARTVEYGAAYARRFFERRAMAQNLGLALRFVDAGGIDDCAGGRASQGYLLDIGWLGTFPRGFRAAAAARNLGKGVTGVRPYFLTERRTSYTSIRFLRAPDPDFSLTPPIFQAGGGWHHDWDSPTLRVLTFDAAGGWTWLRKGANRQEGNFLFETETAFFNALTARFAWTRGDPDSTGNAARLGAGLNFFNHLYADFGVVRSGGDYRDGQKSFSLVLYNLLRWRREDLAWWRINRP